LVVAKLDRLARDAGFLLTVLDGTGDLRVLRLGQPGSEVADLGPAERAHVVVVDVAAARVSFRHPLIRSAVRDMASDAERRDAAEPERKSAEPQLTA
jgi:hypothetical protein